jgi:hypothetical protein
MVAASLFDHPGLILLIVFVALVRWLASRAKSQTQDPQTPSAPSVPTRPIPRGSDTQTEEERIRRFLEALGQPPGTTPPKVAPRRREIRPQIFPKLPPLVTVPPPLPPEPAVQPATPPPLFVSSTMPSPPRMEPRFEVREVEAQTSSEPPPETRRSRTGFDLRSGLGNRQDLRTAIVLREIFGPPRSLQSPDLTSGV